MNTPHRPQLRRVLSLPLITFYGLGTILGAGIFRHHHGRIRRPVVRTGVTTRTLAKATSTIVLLVFALVNLALIRVESTHFLRNEMLKNNKNNDL